MAQQGSGYQARYKRILLKLSGEALMGSEEFGIDPKVLDRMALEVGQLVGIGVQVGLVIGGGREEVMDFANELQKIVGFTLIVVGELLEISTEIGVNSNGREIIISKAGTN